MCICSFSVVFNLLGIFFKFYVRLAIYTNLFIPFVFHWIVKYCPDKKYVGFVYLAVMGYCITYFILEYIVSLGMSWNSPWTQDELLKTLNEGGHYFY